MDFEAILYGTDFVDRVSGRRGDTAFSIGASLGFVLGSLAGQPPMVCAALGYAAVFGSATNTLLAPVLIGMEVFGVENGLAFLRSAWWHFWSMATAAFIRHRNGLLGKNPLTLTLVHGL